MKSMELVANLLLIKTYSNQVNSFKNNLEKNRQFSIRELQNKRS
jgi:hypothetical protein